MTDLDNALVLAESDPARVCVWTYDDYQDSWDTDCGRAFCFEDGSPRENDYRYCPGCGKVLRAVTPDPSDIGTAGELDGDDNDPC